MTPSPSETAIALCQKYSKAAYDVHFTYFKISELAKKCALIDVQGKIELLNEMEKMETGKITNSYGQDDWQQVKEAIPKV